MQQGRRNRGREAERQRAQRQSELSEVRRNVRRGVLAFEWNWAEVGFSIKSDGAFCNIFFFFFFEFQPESADTADSGPSRPNSGRIGPSRSCVGASRRKPRGIHVAQRGWTRGQRRPLLVASSRYVGRGCGTPGAASVLPRLLVSIPSFNKISSINCMNSLSFSL